MVNTILALQALSSILTTIGNASLSVTRIKVVLDKAALEGRDVSDAELAAVALETDFMEGEVLARLKAKSTQS